MSVVHAAPLGVARSPPRTRSAARGAAGGALSKRPAPSDDLEWFKAPIAPVEETFPESEVEFPKSITIGPLTFLPRAPFIAGEGSYGKVGIYVSGDKTIAVKAFNLPADKDDDDEESGEAQYEKRMIESDISSCWDEHVVASRWVPAARGDGGWVAMENLTGDLHALLTSSPTGYRDALLVLSHVGEALTCASFADAVLRKCRFYADISIGNIMYTATPALRGALIDAGGFRVCSANNSFVSTYPSPLTYVYSHPLSRYAGDVADVPSRLAANILRHQQAFGLWSMLLYCAAHACGLESSYCYPFVHTSVKRMSKALERMNARPTKLTICRRVYNKYEKRGIFRESAFERVRAVLEVRARDDISARESPRASSLCAGMARGRGRAFLRRRARALLLAGLFGGRSGARSVSFSVLPLTPRSSGENKFPPDVRGPLKTTRTLFTE